jgi:hypothetical protein
MVWHVSLRLQSLSLKNIHTIMRKKNCLKILSLKRFYLLVTVYIFEERKALQLHEQAFAFD